MTYASIDMHCHVDFFSNPKAFVNKARQERIGLFGVSCTPTDYLATREELTNCCNLRLGVGLHPWWIADGRANNHDLETLLELINHERYIGEIGLDFSHKHVNLDSREQQLQAFYAICAQAAQKGDKVLSIHAVAAANTVLDILEETQCIKRCTCIFHWFSGSNKELWRAIDLDAYFSINTMMLKTKRSKEYVKLIPKDKLLLETDLPPQNQAQLGVFELKNQLITCSETLSGWLGRDIAHESTANALRLLSLTETL